MESKEMDKILGKFLYKKDPDCNNMLEKIINHIILKRYGWIAESEYQDIYSEGAKVLWECCQRYDSKQNIKFTTYFIGCLQNRIKTYITKMNRKKRCVHDEDGNRIPDVALDKPLDEGFTFGETLQSDTNIEQDYIDNEENKLIRMYLARLTNKQRQVAFLIMSGFTRQQIIDKLEMSEQRYNKIFDRLKAVEKIQILLKNMED